MPQYLDKLKKIVAGLKEKPANKAMKNVYDKWRKRDRNTHIGSSEHNEIMASNPDLDVQFRLYDCHGDRSDYFRELVFSENILPDVILFSAIESKRHGRGNYIKILKERLLTYDNLQENEKEVLRQYPEYEKAIAQHDKFNPEYVREIMAKKPLINIQVELYNLYKYADELYKDDKKLPMLNEIISSDNVSKDMLILIAEETNPKIINSLAEHFKTFQGFTKAEKKMLSQKSTKFALAFAESTPSKQIDSQAGSKVIKVSKRH